MVIIRRLIIQIRFWLDSKYGTSILIPILSNDRIFDTTHKKVIQTLTGKIDMTNQFTKLVTYRLGIGVHGKIKPELKIWLNNHRPYTIEEYNPNENHDNNVTQTIQALVNQLDYGTQPYIIRFGLQEDAVLFKLTWL